MKFGYWDLITIFIIIFVGITGERAWTTIKELEPTKDNAFVALWIIGIYFIMIVDIIIWLFCKLRELFN